MATIVAQATGNWSAGGTWVGGTPPGVGDTAQTDAYIVTIDQDITVTQLNPTSSGYFKVTAADIDIVGDVVMASTYNGGGLRFEHAAGTCTLTGNATGGSANNAKAIQHNAAGTVIFTGDATGGTGAGSHGVQNGSTGTLTVVGNVTGGSSSGYGAQNNSTGTLTVSGTSTGGTIPGTTVSYGSYNAGTGTLTVNTAVGGSVNGTYTASGLHGANSGGTTTYKVALHSTSTAFPLSGFCQLEYDQDVNYIRVTRDSDDANVDLSNDYPAEGDVEIGVVYQLGNLTGTLDVGCDYPAEGDVRLGVDYDSGGSTGTLDLPAEADVQEGVTFDGLSKTGTFAAPSEDDVRDGTTYGAAAEFEGNMTLPAEEDVETGVTYGTDGTEYTGTLAGGSDWTADEKEQIRMALGITGDTAATSGTGNLDTILTAVSDLSTDEEIAAAVDTKLAAEHGANSWEGMTAQETADALLLAPDGEAAAGSVMAQVAAILVDTGTTLDDKLDAIKLKTDALDVSAVTQVAASSAGHLTITAGLTFDEEVSGLTIPADWAAAIWTLKQNAAEDDDEALVRLRATNPADAEADGVEWLLGAAVALPMTLADGVLTVDQAGGSINVYLTDELTALLSEAGGLGWDVKFIDESDDSTGQRGTADVALTETWMTE